MVATRRSKLGVVYRLGDAPLRWAQKAALIEPMSLAPRKRVSDRGADFHDDAHMERWTDQQLQHGRKALDVQGFAVAPAMLDADAVAALTAAIAQAMPEPGTAGQRDLAGRVSAVRTLVDTGGLLPFVTALLGNGARLVRSILFNKSVDSNWRVAWHQDLTIAVEARHALPGYRAWSVKDGRPHVIPPVSVLARMLTVRLHLDPADADNGALRVLPGSHRLGCLAQRDIPQIIGRGGEVTCCANAGDALLMRPLLLHASQKSRGDRARRVLHLEFAVGELDAPLRWASQPGGAVPAPVP
jgi:hypothetical protein